MVRKIKLIISNVTCHCPVDAIEFIWDVQNFMWLVIDQLLNSFHSSRNESQRNCELPNLSLFTQQTNHMISVQSRVSFGCVLKDAGISVNRVGSTSEL